ncbi:MAG TPA: ferritin-like domain-containing protein, partial [Nannocystis sp.]
MDDATPAPRKLSRLAIASCVVGGLGLAAVALSPGADQPGDSGKYLMVVGGLAILLGIAGRLEIYAKEPAYGGGLWALAGTLVGLGALVVGFMMHFAVGATHGRPLRLRGRVAAAPTTTNEAWIEGAAPDLEGLTPALRERLGKEWLQDAREEHASIPAFSLLSLHLTRLAAPPELVVASHHAALDEVTHARRCFALASAYLGRPCGPAGWAALATASQEVDLATLACEALADGCVGEGTAAEVAAAAAAQARDPVVRAVLVDIARDEARHAALAWDVLAWALAAGGEAVAQAVSARARALPVAAVDAG